MEKIFQTNHRQFEPFQRSGLGSARILQPAPNSARMSQRPQALCGPEAGTILVPLDVPHFSRACLDIAQNLARESGATLVLLHAVWLNIVGEERGIHRFRIIQEMCRHAESQLKELSEQMGPDIGTKVIVREGLSADAILETARHLQADAVIMQTHARRGWHKWFHRNTASKVIRQSPCPVWLVGQSNTAKTVDLVVLNCAPPRQISPTSPVASM